MRRDPAALTITAVLVASMLVGLATPADARTAGASAEARIRAAVDSGVVHPRVAAALKDRGSVNALVTFAYEGVLARAKASAAGMRSSTRTDAILAQTRPVYAAEKRAVLADADAASVIKEYDALPVSFVRFSSADALAEVAGSPDVVSVMPNERMEAQLAESLPLIHQPEAQARSYTGAGTAVAVLDTGVWYTDPEFGSCTSPGVPAGCKVAFAKDFGTNDYSKDRPPWHGSNVAGIVLGVAPSTDILALDVFDGSGSKAYSDDVIAAIDWVVSTQSTYNTRAMNLSLGSQSYFTSECSTSDFAAAFASARAVGVLPVVASGNSADSGGSFTSGVAHPACAPGAVRVGAVYDSAMGTKYWGPGCSDVTAADKVTCFSQTGPLLTILAPGSVIVADRETMSGTSQAAPHVAGAAAVLAAAAPNATLTQVTDAMTTSGASVLDPRVSQTYPRLDLNAAVNSITASFPWLSADVVGPGSVISTPAGINCPGICSRRYPPGSSVQLQAVAPPEWYFMGWSGACTGATNPCEVSMYGAPGVTATFAPGVTLSVTVAGSGSVVTAPAGVNCPGVCSYKFSPGSNVQVGAVAEAGWHFTGFSGACTGTANPCTVSMNEARSITATFTPNVPFPTLSTTVVGSGLVTSSPSGVYCPGVCAATFAHGTSVQLTAAPSAGWSFTGWSGACTGTTNPCTVSMTQGRSVTATFTQDPLKYLLSVTTSGSGSVTSAPSGISCPGTCGASYDSGTSVSMTATPDAGWSFSWSGACSGSTNPCTVSMTQARSVTATFTQNPMYRLTVNVIGSGSVSSNLAGISCPGSCQADYVSGTGVSLKAVPSAGWYLSSWSGACTGTTNPCTVSMTQARNVTATFKAYTSKFALLVDIKGSGGVTSDPKGISCPDICEAAYEKGTQVSLTAIPSPGWSFAGWDGACAGTTNPCVVPMDQAQKVGAIFTEGVTQYPLAVLVDGWGVLRSEPRGIDCPDVCEAVFDEGTNVMLTATAESGWSFAGWDGACVGLANPCVVPMSEAQKVGAIFTKDVVKYPLTVGLTGSGKVSSAPTGIYCPGTCEASFDEGTVVQLTALPRSGWSFTWEGGCSGSTNPCSVPMTEARKVGVVFAPKLTYPLLVTVDGEGSVSSDPKGIGCPDLCEAEFPAKSEVQLSAIPQAGWSFARWDGACSGSINPCVVPMSEAQKVSATFTQDIKPYPLWVSVEGSGGVESDPAGIGCPGISCAAEYGDGTNVTLKATADDGWLFASWSGACTGDTNSCVVPMTSEKYVTATFSQAGIATTTTGTMSGGYGTKNGYRMYHVRSRATYTVAVTPLVPGVTVASELWKWNKYRSIWELVWTRNPTLDPTGSARLRARGSVLGKGSYFMRSAFPGDVTHLASTSELAYFKFTR